MSTVQVTKPKDKPIEKGHIIGTAMNTAKAGEFVAVELGTPFTYIPEIYTKPKPKLERMSLSNGGYIHINLDEKREATPSEVTEYLDGLHNTMNEVRYGVIGNPISFTVTMPSFSMSAFGSAGYSPSIDTTKISLATKKLDTILKQTHTLKKKLKGKGQEWTKMEDVAPKWHNKISTYFADPKNNSDLAGDLARSSKCIMGEAFDGSPNWGYNTKEQCPECSYLGTYALKLFSSFDTTDHATIRLTDSEGWNNYQARFEYHWNQKHS